MSHLFAATLFLMVIVQPPTIFAQSQTTQPPQRGQRSAAKPSTPMTLRQVLESLSASHNSSRVEGMIEKSGVQFQATSSPLDILKQFGASPKLLSLIPAPTPTPTPPQPPPPKIAGPLTIVCEPKECEVAVNEKYAGPTDQNRKTIVGLPPGETTIQIFSEGYEHVTHRTVLEEGTAKEEKFLLKRTLPARQDSGKASLLKALASLGGVAGLVDLEDIDIDGTMQWTDIDGKVQQWSVSFNRRPGRNLVATFRTPGGQCTASILAQTAKQECKGALKSGDKIAEQGTSLFLSYQLQDVLQALLQRPLLASEADENHVESIDTKDSYILTLAKDGSPADLIYRVGEADRPIEAKYSSYVNVGQGRYPGQISLGRPNSTPSWVFTVKSVRNRVARSSGFVKKLGIGKATSGAGI